MKENIKKSFSNKVISRLTLYHCILTHTLTDTLFVSSFEIASLLGIDDSQVRKDIALCGVYGRQKSGYPAHELKQAIEQKLGVSQKNAIIIVGAGNLGSALSNYSDLMDYGIEIVALFDSDDKKIGKTINKKEILPISQLSNFIHHKNINTVILTVPPDKAQEITDTLVQIGVCYIWNFTPCILKVPKNVTVQYENIIGNFLQMKNNAH